MNIMLASVLEQTREIGVRRAVGALRKDIRFQFLVTSFTISVLGGIAGITLGVVIAKVVAAYADWPTVVTLTSIVVSTGVSVFVGLVFRPVSGDSRIAPQGPSKPCATSDPTPRPVLHTDHGARRDSRRTGGI